MPVNPGFEYQRAEEEHTAANTIEEKLEISKKMLKLVPKHKSSENLVALIRSRISKYQKQIEKQKIIAKKSGKGFAGIKKEGAARVCIIGITNSGKSTLLSKITNAKPRIDNYSFTTKDTEIGTLDHRGIKIQVIEIPAIIENFKELEKGSYYASIMKESDLILLVYKDEKELKLIRRELRKLNVEIKRIEHNPFIDTSEDIKYNLWKNLGLILVYTKQPHKEKELPPIALKKGSIIKDIATKVHKDFVNKFKFAKIFGSSAKFDGQQVGIDHVLKDEDIVELYLKD